MTGPIPETYLENLHMEICALAGIVILPNFLTT